MKRNQRDADFHHLLGSDDLAHIRAQPNPVVVRVLTPKGKHFEWRSGAVFSVWDTTSDDWMRNKVGSRRSWGTIERAEAAMAKISETNTALG